MQRNCPLSAISDILQRRKTVPLGRPSLGALSLEKHPDKTFIGRIERGFDFLGYHFSPEGLTVSKKDTCRFY